MAFSFASLLVVTLAIGGYLYISRMRVRRTVTPKESEITLRMQQKMARACVTMLTSGGVSTLLHIKKQASIYKLRKVHFEHLMLPPEEDGARAQLMREFR